MELKTGQGQAAIFLCATLWSTSGLFIKLVNWHPIVIAGGRSLIAALFLLTMRLLLPRKAAWKPRPVPMIAAALAYALTMLTFVTANKLTTSANAILLQYTAPVWAAILGWILIKEKPHWEIWGALALVLLGLVVFFSDRLDGGSFTGNCIALLSGFFFGANSVLLRMQKNGNPQDSMIISHIICVIISVPFFVNFVPQPSVAAIGAILFMGLIQIGLASFLFAYGIKRVKAVQAMLTAMIEPILNPVWVLLITGERPSTRALVGGALIVASVVASSIIGKRRSGE
jgi:drug/metabolite transporter (DMT)-like permease